MTLKQLEVQIMGQSYLLGAPEGGEQQLLTAVEKVDTAMCKIRDAGKVKARDRIAVLAALNLAFETARPSASNPNTTSAAAPLSVANSQVHPDHDDPRWGALVSRLDQALGSDGQLL
jgi:cell division protein ZapA